MFLRVGVLPYRRRDGRVLFPWGEWTGVYCSPELKFAEEHGADIEVLCGVFWKDKCYPFTRFVDKWYEIKRRGGGWRGGTWRAIAKLVLNSLCGKFGEKEVRELWRILPFDKGEVGDVVLSDDYVLRRVPVVVRRDYHRVYVSAFVTCYARIILGGVLKSFEADVVYCDTDSVMLKCPLPPEMVSDDELGKWKFEGVWDFVGGREKFYALLSGEEVRVKLKGAPRSLVDPLRVVHGIGKGYLYVEGVVPNTFYSYLRGGGYLRVVEKMFVTGSEKRSGALPRSCIRERFISHPPHL